MEERLAQAETALEAGNAGQAIGLADGVVRAITQEREAMDTVQRALRQRKKLVAQFEARDDSEDWEARMLEIEKAADERQWSQCDPALFNESRP